MKKTIRIFNQVVVFICTRLIFILMILFKLVPVPVPVPQPCPVPGLLFLELHDFYNFLKSSL